MRIRIHHPLFAGFLGVVGLLIVLLTTLVGRGLSRELWDTFRADLHRHVALGSMIVANAETANADSLTRAIGDRIGFRVTLIDTTGVVIGDSFVDPGQLVGIENHIGRPEVQGALEGTGTVHFADRVSATVGLALLYGARMTVFNGEPVIFRVAAPETDIVRTVDRVQQTVVVTGLFAMVVSLFAAYILSRAFARPLVQLAERARQLADGNVATRVPEGRVAELQDVADAFNRLTEELQARLGELSLERDEMQTLIDCMAEGVIALTEDGKLLRVNRTARALLDLSDAAPHAPIGSVIEDPELRSILEESVVRSSVSREIRLGGRNLLLAARSLDHGGAVTTFLDITELRRLESVRRDFVANASHELKTPLTAIRGYAETLMDGDTPDDLRRQFLGSIEKNTLRMQRLVDDLLDLSRLESGGWQAETESVMVAGAAEEAWEQVRDSATQKGVTCGIDAEVRVLGDQRGLVQIFRNLLENAVRHVEPDGRVDVLAVRTSPTTVEIEVVDNGEGIPVQSLDRVFERFFRADSSRARDFGGTGLGLAIVRHLVVAMGGGVEAESEVGKGTTIRLSLPAA